MDDATILDPASQPVIVVGAGPVGLTAALLLAQQGHRVTVYEGKTEIPLSDDNSYPIGVNPRGQEALRRIDPTLLDRLRHEGEVVHGWRIYAAGRLVAKLASGTVISTTRAFVNRILLDAADASPSITIVRSHKLVRVDLDARRLKFATPSGESATIEAADARVICADGVWSAARRSMTEQLDDFAPQVGEWGVRFRVLSRSRARRRPGWTRPCTTSSATRACTPRPSRAACGASRSQPSRALPRSPCSSPRTPPPRTSAASRTMCAPMRLSPHPC